MPLVRAAHVSRVLWRACTGCGRLFPASPADSLCPACAGWS